MPLPVTGLAKAGSALPMKRRKAEKNEVGSWVTMVDKPKQGLQQRRSQQGAFACSHEREFGGRIAILSSHGCLGQQISCRSHTPWDHMTVSVSGMMDATSGLRADTVPFHQASSSPLYGVARMAGRSWI
jgi:hypothetical protein